MAKEQAKGKETTCCIKVRSKLNIGKHPNKQTNKQTCNLPNSPETKHGKAKNDRKKSLDEFSAEQNHLHPYLALVNGTSKSKETMNCCSDSCKLQSLCLSGRNDGAQPHFCSHDQSTPLLALNTCCNTQKARC